MNSFARRNRAIAASAAFLAAGCGSGEQAECISPPAVTEVFPGDETADPENQATWSRAVSIEVEEFPASATGVIVGFAGPGESEWRNTSDTIGRENLRPIAMLVGHEAVQFGVMLVALEGSSTCTEPPEITYEENLYDQFIEQGHITPSWDGGNPLND